MEQINCILLIDDDEINNLLNTILLQERFPCDNIKVYTDASEALVFLQTTRPALILLDLQMPLMEGKEFLEELKKLNIIEERLAKVVVLSAYISESRRSELELLNIPYLEKPLTVEKLDEILGRIEIRSEDVIQGSYQTCFVTGK